MKVLFVSAHPAMSLSHSQGYATRISELINGLTQLGHEVLPLIAGDQKVRQSARKMYKQGIKRLLPSVAAQIVRELSFIMLDRQFYLRSREEADQFKPDVIVERYSPFHRTAMWLANDLAVPLVLDDIAPLWEEEIYFRRGLHQTAHHIQDQVFRRADGLIAVSGAIKSYLIGVGVPARKITVIHNGADPDKFSPETAGFKVRQRFNLGDKTVVGFIGGFLPWHGIDVLVETAVDLSHGNGDLRYLLVGPNEHWVPANSALSHKLQNINNCVVFTGSVPYSAVPQYVAAMDITTMPKSNSYGSPIKIFEYMAAGKTVIAPRLKPIEEIITHQHNGWLVDQDQPESLREAIHYLYQRPDIRRSLSIQARQTVLQKFTWLNQAQRLERVCQKVCLGANELVESIQ